MNAALMTSAPTGARFEPGDDGIGRIVIDRPNDSANAIDPPLLAALAAAVEEARQARPRGLILVSAKPDQFVAGADLALFSAGVSAADIAEASRAMQRIVTAIQTLPFTTVAAINGSALGGGFELALACDYRVAADTPSVRIGLPEVQLGLLPAGAGTQLLPRLVGLSSALDLILGARRLSARRALKRGLVDEVVHPASLERAARDRALTGRKRGLPGGRAPLERATTWLAPVRAIALRTARERVRKETRGHFPAPLRAIDAIALGLDRGIDAGLELEARAFGELATGTVARNLIGLFVLGLRQRRAAFADLPRASAPIEIGIVGAGLMGAGIAQAAAVAGMSVRLRDVDDAAVTRGLDSIRSLTEAAGRKGVIDRRDSRRAIARVTSTTDWTGFARSTLVIEAVFEELAVKKRVLAELEAVAGDDTVIASNTSALPIAEIAADARHPERIVGMHFFSPVHRMPLVEVVWPKAADPSAVARVVAAGQGLGKTVIVVRDGPGFYTTRTLGVMLGEAARLLEEGLAIEEIDAAMTRFGWPVGPLALIDEVGIAVARHAGETVASGIGAAPQRNAVQLLADAGLVGKRGGEGFYRYEGGRRVPNPRVYELLGTSGIRPASDQLGPMLTGLFVNEAARCLDEGILRSAAEGDLGAVLGLGFPPFLGGPFRYADDYANVTGASLADRLRAYANVAGPRYAPADSIASGRPFHP